MLLGNLLSMLSPAEIEDRSERLDELESEFRSFGGSEANISLERICRPIEAADGADFADTELRIADEIKLLFL